MDRSYQYEYRPPQKYLRDPSPEPYYRSRSSNYDVHQGRRRRMPAPRFESDSEPDSDSDSLFDAYLRRLPNELDDDLNDLLADCGKDRLPALKAMSRLKGSIKKGPKYFKEADGVLEWFRDSRRTRNTPVNYNTQEHQYRKDKRPGPVNRWFQGLQEDVKEAAWEVARELPGNLVEKGTLYGLKKIHSQLKH